jgi:hypothetical protein
MKHFGGVAFSGGKPVSTPHQVRGRLFLKMQHFGGVAFSGRKTGFHFS